MTDWPKLKDIAKDVNSGKTSAEELVKKSLSAVGGAKEYQAIISSLDERAIIRAKEVDAKIKKGESAGRLAGVPFIAKDNFLTLGGKTTAASNILKPYEAIYQSSAIEKLEAEGAICVAKANLDAFAHGSSTENSDFFTTLNPHDKSRVPGGSSGGSTASVMLGLAPFALGTDTGGSVRLPASFCGVVGYKPTYGLVSRSGVVAMASSTDVIGPITKNVEDAGLVLDVMAGQDGLDSTMIEKSSDGYDIGPESINLSELKIGVIKEYFSEGLDEEVSKSVKVAINKLEQAGAKVEEVSLPSLPLALAVYYVICPAEVASNLGRYDGQRFGYSEKSAKDLDESYELSRKNGFGAEAKRRIMIGAYVLSSGYYDAYYKKAQTVRTKIINEFDDAFTKYDILIGPTSPGVAFKIGANTDDPLKMYMADIMTVGSNITGVPSVSIPAKTNGLPVGLQLIAKQKDDRRLLQVSKAAEGLMV